MPNVTLAFDEGVRGWTSEFTFLPDSGLSLNNKFFTFKNGRIYEHNSSVANRNTFYGVSNDTIIRFVFNENPVLVKNFKNINFEGTELRTEDTAGVLTPFGWSTELETNLETGYIRVDQYVLKEGENYGFVRGNEETLTDVDFSSSNVGGIGSFASADGDITTTDGATYTFDRPIPIGIQPDDLIYGIVSGETNPTIVGSVLSVTNNTITIDRNNPKFVNTLPTDFRNPTSSDLLIYVKDSQVEKSGIIGYYSVATFTNNDVTRKTELFSATAGTHIQNK